jgi:hypothetical protein
MEPAFAEAADGALLAVARVLETASSADFLAARSPVARHR